MKCFVWSVALYGAETWTVRRSEEKRIEAFEMWIRRRMERVKWTDRIRNEAVLEKCNAAINHPGSGRSHLRSGIQRFQTIPISVGRNDHSVMKPCIRKPVVCRGWTTLLPGNCGNVGASLGEVHKSTRGLCGKMSEEKRIEAFEMWIWRRMERVKWTERVRNEAVLERVDKERIMLKLMRTRKRNWLSHWMRRNCLLKDALEGMVNGRRVRGSIRYQMIDNIKIYGSYAETKSKAGEC
ncbi:hypothetical protein ANN_19000 [Periplaneta americana]|uniref:Uncharacterized protein n=1 Tax=Periplaneta americana TaxID=6978 RepID=A0ABQ8SR16_PERAM|nr:hypothetical protein ANN_19000 [Periplaneta americana]